LQRCKTSFLGGTRSVGEGEVCFSFVEKLKIFQQKKNKPFLGFYRVSSISSFLFINSRTEVRATNSYEAAKIGKFCAF
jgi:hypothetical protein